HASAYNPRMTATTNSATTKTSQLQIRVNPDQKRMIAAAARRAGMDMSAYVLERVLGSSQRRIQEIARRISDKETRRYGYAELHDLLMSLSTPELQRAIGERAFGNLPPDVENYVAAMIEQACIQRRI